MSASDETSTGSSPSTRLHELDSLRAIAAIAVVAYHYTTSFDQMFGWPTEPAFLVPWGHYGVNLFFVISGFVITASTERSPRATTFAANRVARIFPTYVAAVLIASPISLMHHKPGLTVAKASVNLTMLQRFLGMPNADGVYWTLAVELLFYAFVFVLLATGWWRRPWRDWSMVAWSCASLVWVMLPFSGETRWIDRPFGQILLFGPLFIWGVALREGPGPEARTRVPTAIALAVGTLSFVVGVSPSEFAISAGCVALVAAAIHLRPAPLRWRPLVAVGEASYVLYLLHHRPGFELLRALRGHVPPTIAVLITMAVAVAVSIPLHRRFERPANRAARRRLLALAEPTRTGAAAR